MTAEQCTPAVKGEGAPIANYTMPRIWDELSISSKFEARQAEVDAFNNANVRADIIGHTRIKSVGKYQSCMV